MIMRQLGRNVSIRMTAGAVALLLAGCAGPSTRVLPRVDTNPEYQMPGDIPVLEEVNTFYLQEELARLTRSPRPSGSRGESSASAYIRQLLGDYGYETAFQPFQYRQEDGTVISGTNVTAVRSVSSPDADILILCAHHDTEIGSPGAVDDTAGVVTMLETARLLARLPSDTELRFVSFSGHEEQNLGSRHYVSTMTEEERNRVIGVIDLDRLGAMTGGNIILGTVDRNETMLGDLLLEASREITDTSWSYERCAGGDASSFLRGRIPAVTVTRRQSSFGEGTPYDRAETVNIEDVAQIVDVICQAVSKIMSLDTPSMTAKAHYYNNFHDLAYVQAKDQGIPFGVDPERFAELLGMDGVLSAENTTKTGVRIQNYQFPMKWFGVDQTIVTSCYFLDGKLDSLSIEADRAGVDFEDMKERLSAWYGEPRDAGSGPSGTSFEWTDALFRRSFLLTPGQDGFDLEVSSWEPGRSILEQRTVSGTLLAPGVSDPRGRLLCAFTSRLLPEDAVEHIGCLTLYTDGVGGETCYLQRMPSEDEGEKKEQHTEDGAEAKPAKWEIGIDFNDAMTENGRFRDQTETAKMIVRLYGQILEQEDPARYRDGFEAETADGISEDPNQGLRIGEAPGDFTEELPPPPNFEDSFWMYVLTDWQRQEQSVEAEGGPAREVPQTDLWEKRIRYFDRFPELVSYRWHVRMALKLDVVEDSDGEE